MKAIAVLKALGPVDYKSIRRDSLLNWIIFLPLGIALLLRFLIPWLAQQVLVQFHFDIRPYYPLLVSMILQLAPMMCGMVIGFLLLDQRDDQTLTALQVTPLSLNGYFLYRISLPVVLSLVMGVMVVPLLNLANLDFISLLAAALTSAPLAPIFALFLGVFAQNKVQGFALMKSMGAVFIPPLVAYLITSPWQLAFGLAPTYWSMKVFWVLHAGEPFGWIYLIVGLVYQALLIWLLVRRFNKAINS
jgi:fluoroquinolone transport system permease protein